MVRNHEELEYGYQQAYVMINCEDGAQERVLEELKSIECIIWAASVVGPYDIVAKIAVPSIDVLRETISFKIREIQKVRTTTTMICEQSKSFTNSIEGKMCYV